MERSANYWVASFKVWTRQKNRGAEGRRAKNKRVVRGNESDTYSSRAIVFRTKGWMVKRGERLEQQLIRTINDNKYLSK